jgi:carboxyl-terminal processing protease
MHSLKSIRLLILSTLALILTFFGGYRLAEYNLIGSSQASQVDSRVMNEVLVRLKQSYLNPDDIKADELSFGAASGMTASLGDPYTAFYPPTENQRSKEDLQGEFGGVGIQLGYIEKTLAVMSPLSGTPADRAGVQAGDLILRIVDKSNNIDKDTTGIMLDEAVNLIRGLKGTEVILTMYREGDTERREVVLVRDTINVLSTEVAFVDDGRVAHISVNRFGEKTLPEWEAIVDQIKAKGVNKIVLDLRNNPGGYLQRAVDLAAEFVNGGVIVKQRDRQGEEVLSVMRKGRLLDADLVVLINRGSASASEILAGALRDRIGTTLIGENTFGKGTVQEVQELSRGTSLHVTVAEWLLPSGTNIHKTGLKPDIEIKYENDEMNPERDNQLEKAIEVVKSI